VKLSDGGRRDIVAGGTINVWVYPRQSFAWSGTVFYVTTRSSRNSAYKLSMTNRLFRIQLAPRGVKSAPAPVPRVAPLSHAAAGNRDHPQL
jgi:hypothetical protein